MVNEELYQKEYAKLTPRQKEAVDTVDGPVMVVAGPGTGKTQVLGLRVANILRTREVGPSNVLCLTFTEAGALNMRERLVRFTGSDAYRVHIATFHGFCNGIIAHYPEFFHDAVSFAAVEPLEQASIVEELFSSLPYKHPLGGRSPTGDFAFRGEVLSRIENIKRAGLSSERYHDLVEELIGEHKELNKTLKSWPPKISKGALGEIANVAAALAESNTSYGRYLSVTLARALEDTRESGKTETVTAWKKKFVEKGDDGETIFKDTAPERVAKMRALAELYMAYENALHARERYDFSDMILDVRAAIEDNATLRNELEEQYQYVLIDEFQDTNEAQLGLVRAITSSPIHEGRPNVMVVGDDDQAIFKFQGAELSNILSFREMYRDVARIVLDKNFRSHQRILDAARAVVIQGDARLENRIKDLSKELVQGNENILAGEVHVDSFTSESEEYTSIARRIKGALDAGIPAHEIAIIGREHKDIGFVLPYLDREGIPYAYERRANVFDEPHVRELITVCAWAASVVGEGQRRDDLLPSILAYPYWNVPRVALYALAIEAKDAHKSWGALLSETQDPHVAAAAAVLMELAAHAGSLPLEHFLDEYMTRSGFREYYFGEAARKAHPGRYFGFLDALKTFVEALRGWREGEPIFAADVDPFVRLHEEQKIGLTSVLELTGGADAVQVMSAHKSKGLEFDVVFLLRAHEKVWAKKKRGGKVPVPAPLVERVTPAGDNEDDFIRILYVAMTRAKSQLYISGHEPLVRFLDGGATMEGENEGGKEEEDEEEGLSAHVENFLVAPPYAVDERAQLAKLVENYTLSVTHLNNFCDVTKGGPSYFLEQNFLRLPQPMSASSVYGSAVDAALTELVRYPRFNAGERAPLDRLLAIFVRELKKGRLPLAEEKKQRDRGERVIARYLDVRGGDFGVEDVAQADFRGEGIVLEGAPVTGKIDLLTEAEGAYRVVDFKTGKVAESWRAREEYRKVQLHHYKQQLTFYKLLLEASKRHPLDVGSLALEFVEGVLENEDGRPTWLEYMPTEEEGVRLAKLAGAVYAHVKDLDFPDIRKYPETLDGVIAFEDDLIAGTI